MRQRIFLKIETGNSDRYIRKAKNIITEYCPANMPESIKLDGIDYEKYMIAGEDIDIPELCIALKKKVGPTRIMSVTPDGFMPPPNLPPPMGSNPPPSSASSTHSSAAPYHYGQQQAPIMYGQPPIMYGGHPNNLYNPPPYHGQETCSIM